MTSGYTVFNEKFWAETGQAPVVGIIQRGVVVPDETRTQGCFYDVQDGELLDSRDSSCGIPNADFATVEKMVITAVNLHTRMECYFVSPGLIGGLVTNPADAAVARQNWRDYKTINGLSATNPPPNIYVTIITNGAINGTDDLRPNKLIAFVSCAEVTFEPNTNDGTYEYYESFFVNIGSSNPFLTPSLRTIPDPAKCFSFVVNIQDPYATACMVPLNSPFCKNDPVTLGKVENCFPASQTFQGALQFDCTFWWETELDQGRRDAYITAMAGVYPDLIAFKCTNASLDPSFLKLVQTPQFAGIKKGCFWRYCDNTDLTVLVKSTDSRQECPNNVCINASDLDGITESEVNDLQQNMTCFTDDRSGGGGGGGGGDNGGGGGQEEQVREIGVIMLVVGIVVGLFFLVAGIWIYLKNRSKKDEKKKG